MTPQQENALRSIARQANSEIKKARQQFPDKNVDDICRSVLKKHRETVQATRKDPTKPKSPYLTTRQSGMATNRHAATSCLGESRREQIKPRHWCGAERYRL